ncbi:alpha/beta hydrolase family protein [Micromonospora fluostatini]|uniref:alpha/beta hydrolase family protein n=1 Tax=Micromonospora sp. JCM 30529 TaxID=3421643 RepID=UPI003D186C16
MTPHTAQPRTRQPGRPAAGRALAVLLLTLLMLLPGGAVSARTPAGPALALPAPTGRHPVGTTWLHLTDHGRADPWRPELPRELMVSVWYPATRAAGPPAPYTTAGVSARIVAATGLPVPPELLTTVRTTARRDVPVRPGRWPLVVLSPGFSLSRESLTGLAEELASQGYVVAGVDHPYEAYGVEFPDGRVADCLACDAWGEGTAARVVAGRAADVAYLLDRLLGKRQAWPGARFVDPARIAMVGHSIGGASAVHTLRSDRRVDAAAVLDGTLFVPVPAGAVDRPVLLVGADREPDHSWVRDWPGLAGWKRWLTVAGTGHMSFTDRPVLGAQLGLDPGAVPAERQLLITREYVTAFVDRHLRHRPAPLLDGARPRFPEVTVTAGAPHPDRS